MNPTPLQLAAFKAIRQEAQNLLRTRLSNARAGLERILTITRAQIDIGCAALPEPAKAEPEPTEAAKSAAKKPDLPWLQRHAPLAWLLVL